jgi:lysozyme|tara:strand:- start:3924 stop:4412 length:489 start_codon:yes stop_codon:yes gene_type:complete
MKYDKQKFVDKLIAHEGLVLKVYKDSLGIDTIGIGRNLKDRGITKQELDFLDIPSMDAVYEHGISELDAYFLANNDVKIVETELLNRHPCLNELDAVRQLVLMDMAFNMGVPRLCKFKKMWAAIHDNDFATAAKEMLDSRWAKQVKGRATKLAHAMASGDMI